MPAPLILLIFMLLVVAVPLYQLSAYGVIFYANALDESNYLQYHHSKLAAELMVRPVQRLVNLLHENGLSGGMIHLLFDAALPCCFVLLCAKCFARARLFEGKELLYALGFLALPLLIGSFNPAVAYIHAKNLSSGMIYWFSTPDAAFPPLLRTPEPQFSWTIVAAASLGALHFRTIWPILIVLPGLYTFVAVPLAFITGCLLCGRFLHSKALRPLIPAAVFIGLSALLGLYFNYFVREEAMGNILKSRLPVISYCGMLSCLLYAALRNRLSGESRFVFFIVALAPWAAANTQIISGFVTAPSNFEQYFGVCAASLLLLLLIRRSAWEPVYLSLAFGVFLLFALSVMKEHRDYIDMLPPDEKLLTELRTDASRVAINHVKLAVLYNQIFPMQKPTFFSYSKMYWGEARREFPAYMCAKKLLLEDQNLRDAFANTFMRMDAAYRYETEDDPLITLTRRDSGPPHLDVDTMPGSCGDLNLKIFTIKKGY